MIPKFATRSVDMNLARRFNAGIGSARRSRRVSDERIHQPSHATRATFWFMSPQPWKAGL